MDSCSSDGIELRPIGVVRSPRTNPTDDNWGSVVVGIELDAVRFTPASLVGLETFSHVEVVFYMDQVRPEKVEVGARHPRNRSEWPKVGIFAQRAKDRPNQIGVSRCEIVTVDELSVTVRGLDAIDGTPVLDMKPYMHEFGPRGDVSQPAWVSELMSQYYGDTHKS
jgi:tRNA-Thr(GGU) m(6)t(6)A37 methyltransferase TsaA